MKVSIISTIFATLLATSSAAPFNTHCQSQIDALRQIQLDTLLQFEVTATFYGAAGASFTQQIPADGQTYPITNPLSISYIGIDGGALCRFFGIDGRITTVVGPQIVPVGPPQTQIAANCIEL
ncbi:hypothetical protein V8E54_009680 [Elaphomyces granulatus]